MLFIDDRWEFFETWRISVSVFRGGRCGTNYVIIPTYTVNIDDANGKSNICI